MSKASGPCAELRAQRLIAATPSFNTNNPLSSSQNPIENQEQNVINENRNVINDNSNVNETIQKLINEASSYARTFDRFVSFPCNDENILLFESSMSDFIKFLQESNNQLPGPIHPSVTYYRKRKQKRDVISNGTYRQSSNPQRSSQRQRKKRNEKYQYDLIQWQYANQRRKVAQSLLKSKKPVRLLVDMSIVEQHFRDIYENLNDNVRESYESSEIPSEPTVLDVDDIILAVKKISIDTSPGPDKIIMRTIRQTKCAEAILNIGKIMLKWNYVPQPFRIARTILIYKGKGAEQDLNNWRPITIFSILRRIIEKCLDKKLRMHTQFSQYQRGFVAGIAGTHINASIVDGCLKISKNNKMDCCVVMLDLAKAFDKTGHLHIKHTLEALPIPIDLKNIVTSLTSTNSTKIEVNNRSSSTIHLNCGVAQGLPLSPTIFNLCQDHILKLISDPSVAADHGFELSPELDKITALAFADDTAIIARNEDSAIALVEILQTAFLQVGMMINPLKSIAINIKQGILNPNDLVLSDNSHIHAVEENETIRYLGVNFSNGIVFDRQKFLKELESDFRNLITSPLLRGDQKLNILDQYIFPKLVYPLQTTPVDLLEQSFLESVDSLIRQGVREIVGLPADTPIPVYYSGRKVRGLGLVRVSWEASLQHINICNVLLKYQDPHLHIARDCESELQNCKTKLNITEQETVRAMRTHLRDKEFEIWSGMIQRGIGVKWYKSFPLSNQWVSNKQGLTSSEWTNAIKLSMNSMANRGTGGRSRGNRHCRHPVCNENNLIETIPHIRGVCPKSELLRNSAHNKIRTATADLFRQKGWEVHEEIHCEAITDDGGIQNRRADIIAIDRRNNKALIIDPTLRWESNDEDQDIKIDNEKKSIYQATIPYFKSKYRIDEWKVHGLWFGVRGTASPLLINFFRDNNLSKNILKDLCMIVLKDTMHIIHRHFYT